MSFVAFMTALIVGMMLGEQRLSRRNEAALLQAGAVAPPGDVYLALAWLYPAAFLAMGLEGAWRAHTGGVAAGGPSWAASGVMLFIASKALKYWAIRSLGVRWSFRVLVEPGKQLVTSGPYQYISHPNYVAVIGELGATAMMMGARISGPVMMALFGLALAARIRFESGVLRRLAGRPES